MEIDRKQFLRLAGLGGIVFASGLARGASAAPAEEFYFVQLSDSHWGFSGPPNPEAATTLKRAVEAVNRLDPQPDFIVFTGDLTHTTDDEAERRRRLAGFRDIVGGLRTKNLRFMPGEHDASLDKGAAYQEFFGATNYAFDHKGVHFIALDNVSDPTAALGSRQIEWLHADLAKLDKAAPVAVLTHRPLFDLYPQWDWATRDAAPAIEMLSAHENVTVFYGHIHQEHHQMTGHIAHHAAQSLIFPLPAPGSQPKRVPVAWDPARPFAGLGWRSVTTAPNSGKAEFDLKEHGLA
jgi:3',5'-cyclic AMP phosphodiesterase CpdA